MVSPHRFWYRYFCFWKLRLTTKLLMRTIMDIARSEGEDIYIEGQWHAYKSFV
jgi:hypothetical protein